MSGLPHHPVGTVRDNTFFILTGLFLLKKIFYHSFRDFKCYFLFFSFFFEVLEIKEPLFQ